MTFNDLNPREKRIAILLELLDAVLSLQDCPPTEQEATRHLLDGLAGEEAQNGLDGG